MKTFPNILKSLSPHLKKALPFLGAGFTGLLGFLLGSKWQYKRYEK